MSEQDNSKSKRRRINRPYPAYSLDDAVAIASSIQEKNAGLPFDRVLLAKAIGTTPASSSFTMRLNASARYGLTEGGYRDERISLTERGEKTAAGDQSEGRRQALMEAAMEPEVFNRFYTMLDGKRLPEDAYAENMLQELGVDATLTSDCLAVLKANGLLVGLLGEVCGSLYVSANGAHAPEEPDPTAPKPEQVPEPAAPDIQSPDADDDAPRGARVFVGHAGNPEIASFIEDSLDRFGIPTSVVECDFDANRPVSAEVVSRMRLCKAAVLVFATPTSETWNGRRAEKRTEKMLYQLGAASALYGDSVISLEEAAPDQGEPSPGFNAVAFHRDHLGEVALEVLSQLHQHGVIKVVT